MFNFFKKRDIKSEYDAQLLDLINQLKENWDYAQKTQDAVADADIQIQQETALAKQKYFYIYKEARRRRVRNDHIQPSVINYDRTE
ncbi:YaaL family protein [Lentilactobacillus sp. Marseille-Q4993]|uniref:YaaL family protein n=1 Tax=Lentilactobacillus sp. Marseille-Q4993 TaxID=3039492 RepID=UPI0024BCCC9D|nr:YaaL family protein [Lentilactobacillus sp. Marseille-Q4993]